MRISDWSSDVCSSDLGFAGLPLYDERHTVLGALLAGSRRGFGEMGIIEPVLRCAAARFSQMLELGRTREQGRAEGLVDALTGPIGRASCRERGCQYV